MILKKVTATWWTLIISFYFLSQSSAYSHCSTELCSLTAIPVLRADAHHPRLFEWQQGTGMAFLWDNSGWKGPQEVSSVIGS